MNILPGKIEDLKVSGSLTFLSVDVSGTKFSVVVIDTPETAVYLKKGNDVKVIFKETEVIIGVGSQHQISLQNKLPGRVVSVESGELLCRLSIETQVGIINSIITANAVNKLRLKEGVDVTAMIKTNEMMLSE